MQYVFILYNNILLLCHTRTCLCFNFVYNNNLLRLAQPTVIMKWFTNSVSILDSCHQSLRRIHIDSSVSISTGQSQLSIAKNILCYGIVV